jgi:PII-like signaling protein
MGVHGGSAFRAIAGYGRHGVLHEQHFFELAGDLTVVVEFIVSDDEAQRLLDLARTEGAHMFYARLTAEFGILSGAG